MPRKKKETPKPSGGGITGHIEGYEVLIGFIKDFKYNDDVTDEMQGHPTIGRVYRLIKDSAGYRLHIGKENNLVGLDGLFLGDSLKASKRGFTFDITVITPSNYLDLELHIEDTKKVIEWLSTDNADMWERLRIESQGAHPILQQIKEIISTENATASPDADSTSVTFAARLDEDGKVNAHDVTLAKILSTSLNTIATKEPEAFYTILYLLEYIASTYQDKYEDSGLPNVSKSILLNSSIGKQASIWNVMKYAQRYLTTGHAKSDNPNDLYKIIHYTLFELQRRRSTDNPTTNE